MYVYIIYLGVARVGEEGGGQHLQVAVAAGPIWVVLVLWGVRWVIFDGMCVQREHRKHTSHTHTHTHTHPQVPGIQDVRVALAEVSHVRGQVHAARRPRVAGQVGGLMGLGRDGAEAGLGCLCLGIVFEWGVDRVYIYTYIYLSIHR